MSIAVTMYTYKGDPRVANKTLTLQGTTKTINPLEPMSNLRMRMVLNYVPENMTADYFSYLENGTTMYYKIVDRQRLPAQAMEIIGELDSVLTYWDNIKDCDCIVDRSTVKYNSKIDDPLYPTIQQLTEETEWLFTVSNEDVVVLGIVE